MFAPPHNRGSDRNESDGASAGSGAPLADPGEGGHDLGATDERLPSHGLPERGGRIEILPVPSLLFRLFRGEATGTLSLANGAMNHAVTVLNGRPVGVRLGGEAVDPLGRILLELGKIGDGDYQSSLATMAETKRLHGQILREMGAISNDDLRHGLQVQLRRKLNRLFHLHQGTFSFDAADEVTESIPAIHPLPVILHGVRSAYDETRLIDILTPLVGLEVRLRGDPVALAADLDPTPSEHKLLSALEHFRPVDELVASKFCSPFETRLLLACLLFIEALDFRDAASSWGTHQRPPPLDTGSSARDNHGNAEPEGDEQAADGSSRRPTDPDLSVGAAAAMREVAGRPPKAPRGAGKTAAPPPAAEPPLDPEPSAKELPPRAVRTVRPPPIVQKAERAPAPRTQPPPRRRSSGKEAEPAPTPNELEALLVAKEKQVASADFFSVLDLDRGAGLDEVKQAYFRLAKRFHPDRFLAGDLRTLRRRAEALFEKISEAHDTLRSEERRKEYVELLDDSRVKGDRRRAQAVGQADAHFGRGQQLMANGDFAGAEEALRRAVEVFHDDAEYHAALGWATYQNPQANVRQRKTNAIKTLLKALQLSGTNERAHLTLGRIYELEGQNTDAARHYQKVIELNPRNTDAATALARVRGGAPKA